MRRIGRAAWSLGLVILASGLISAGGNEPPRPSPQAVDPVDRILEGWHAITAKIASVEVNFLRTDDSPG